MGRGWDLACGSWADGKPVAKRNLETFGTAIPQILQLHSTRAVAHASPDAAGIFAKDGMAVRSQLDAKIAPASLPLFPGAAQGWLQCTPASTISVTRKP